MTHENHTGQPDQPAAAAGSDAGLERELEALFTQLRIEPAPPSLTRRLLRIPLEEGGAEPWWRRMLPSGSAPRWAWAPALAAALLAVGLVVTRPQQPSQTEVLQARHDLAVAFGYIDRAGVLTGQEIHSVLGRELRRTVKGNLAKHIPFAEQIHKEKTS